MKIPGERRLRGAFVLGLGLLSLATLGSTGHSSFPDTPPNDPSYDRWERGVDSTSFYDEQWNLFSFTPRGVHLTRQASGVSADLAWKTTLGRPDVTVAILDSGIRWHERDLVNQYWLNRGELPEPRNTQGVSTPGVYDLNGDGAFNMKDYADDHRFSDVNANGILDPGDLIALASDGVDGDANGYLDDICGWDFFEGDNDPFDNTFFNHGTGRAKEAVAEGNNGIGGIGVAPRSSLMPIRIGDSFVVDVNDYAQGVAFAVDSGVDVVASAIGSVDNTTFARAVAEYARRKGTVLIVGAADENSFHHNFPSAYDAIVAVKAIVPDSFVSPIESRVARLTTTFLQHSGCTNYGPKIELAVPSDSCSSGATGMGGGVGALIVSRGRDLFDQGVLPSPLTTDEVKQIATLTADDVFDPRADHSPRLYPSQPGWDQYYGYGRVNAAAAVQRIGPGTIPPEADLRGPDWFQILDPAKTPEVEISGNVAARRADGYRYVVEYGVGVEPLEEDYVVIRASGRRTEPYSGSLASWNIRRFAAFARKPPAAPNDFTVTVRVRVIDDNGQKAEDRHTIFIHQDRNLHPGFPIDLRASGESSPALADLDGDGAAEIVVATADGSVVAYRGNGTMLPGWPVYTDLLAGLDPQAPHNHLQSPAYQPGGVGVAAHTAIMGSIAVGDVNGSGHPQVVVGDLQGKVYAWDKSGHLLPGFPVATDPAFSRPEDRNENNVLARGIAGAPALGDLDGDGKLDIVVAAMDQRLYAWKGDGSVVPGWPALVRDPGAAKPQGARIVASPAIGDLDGDGRLDVVVGTNEIYGRSGRLYAFGNNGALRRGWPVTVPSLSPEGPDVLPLVGQGIPSAPALADVDGDGKLEVAVAAIAGPVVLYRADGRRVMTMKSGRKDFGPGSPATDGPSLSAITNGSFGDIDGDGLPDFAAGTAGFRSALTELLNGVRFLGEHHVSAWDPRTGSYLSSFPMPVEDFQFFMNPAIADLDGDGLAEVITGTGGYLVHAFNRLGREPQGWPKFTGHWLAASPAVGDVDGDGLLEVVINSREGLLFVWDTKGPVQVGGRPAIQWAKFHHDLRNSGNFNSPLN
jgi:hypothetical protein